MDILKKIMLKSESGKSILDLISSQASDVPEAAQLLSLIPTPCGGKGICGKCKVMVNGEKKLACSTICTTDGENLEIGIYKENTNISIVSNGYLPKFEPDSQTGIGLAIDIGTTTIASYLYDLATAQCLRTFNLKNPQSIYGADVVTRIEKSLNGESIGLQSAIIDGIEAIIKELDTNPDKIVITGNTAMLYLLTNKNVERLARAPFTPDELFGKEIEINDRTVYLERCISAFVGADITSAILSSELCDKAEPTLLVDIGTNGEMAIINNGQILCASTAAGPAFEGAGISCGVNGVPGAICNVSHKDGKILYETIGNQPPIGICGSGIIDAIATLIDLDLIDETGYINYDTTTSYVDEDAESIALGDSGITITQADIRSVQLAKSAICAGLETLIHESTTQSEGSALEPTALYIAGGFGSFINVTNAEKIGLIPKGFAQKSKVLGNSAGMGAIMTLLSHTQCTKATHIATTSTTVDLTTSAFFTDKYIEGMMF